MLLKNTHGIIGVSKRCCLVCTKLLSRLSKHRQEQMQVMVDIFDNEGIPISHEPGLKVLNSYGNIYPTFLPPFLLRQIAEEVVRWLESVLKHAVMNKVVRRERRGSSESVDSRGQGLEEGSVEGDEELGVGTAKGNTTATWTAQERQEAEWVVAEEADWGSRRRREVNWW